MNVSKIILNVVEWRERPTHTITTADIAGKLQKRMLRIKGKYMSKDGKSVDYNAIRNSQELKEYIQESELLCWVDLASLNGVEFVAFFINVYNALTIHAIIHYDLPTSVISVDNFWSSLSYRIGGLDFSLDEIEHGILRGNRPHPSTKRTCFLQEDARLPYSIQDFDPRIHFALNCGSKSCAAIQVYSADNLNSALHDAVVAFCQQEVEVDANLKKIWLSKLFLWYQADFADSQAGVVKWISRYLDATKYKSICSVLQHAEKNGWDSIVFDYLEYDWKLNSTRLTEA